MGKVGRRTTHLAVQWLRLYSQGHDDRDVSRTLGSNSFSKICWPDLRSHGAGVGKVPWWSSGYDSGLSLPWPRFNPLVEELRSHKLCDVAKEKEGG